MERDPDAQWVEYILRDGSFMWGEAHVRWQFLPNVVALTGRTRDVYFGPIVKGDQPDA